MSVTELPERPFGVDIRLGGSSYGGHDARVSQSGDLSTVRGPDTAVQALTLRLLIRRGALAALGWPDYGSRLHELIGEPDVARTRLRLAQYAREAVGSDPRVASIEQVEVATNQLEARIGLSVMLVGGTSVQLAVAVPMEAP